MKLGNWNFLQDIPPYFIFFLPSVNISDNKIKQKIEQKSSILEIFLDISSDFNPTCYNK